MSTPAPCSINVFLDSDGVICDFDAELKKSGLDVDVFKHQPGTYLWLDVVPGAREAIEALKSLDDKNLLRVWVLTKTPAGAPYAYTEKVLWYRRNFPWLEDRVIITHDKHLLGTSSDYLLDDRPHKANCEHFRGDFTLFNTSRPEESWKNFLLYLRLNFALNS
jgi:5'(3')-deoxyribonucleotidase